MTKAFKPTAQQIARFAQAFRGLDRSYGKFDLKNPHGHGITVKQKPTQEVYEHHLLGRLALGIVPIMDDSGVVFGAIDIDDRTIDHAKIDFKVTSNNLPLIVCRSKRGGAHLYTFYSESTPADKVRHKLARWASLLGYGKSEIFPKQSKIDGNSLGSWINLPYLNGDNTDRHAFREGKPVNLDTFLEMVDAIKAVNSVGEVATEINDDAPPPCLQHYIEDGIEDGNRGEVLFAFGIYYRKLDEANWADRLMNANFQYCHPPKPRRDVETIIRSIGRRKYFYRCKEPFLSDHCNKFICRQLQYGTADAKKQVDMGSFKPGQLTRHLTQPPYWIWDIDGSDLILTVEELIIFKKFQCKLTNACCILLPEMNQKDWVTFLEPFISNAVTVEAPRDAGEYGGIQDMFRDFLKTASKSGGRRQLGQGVPVFSEINGTPVIMFKGMDFRSYLKRKKMSTFNVSEIWRACRDMGCDHKRIKVNGKAMPCWFIEYDEEDYRPVDLSNLDTDESGGF